MNKYAIGTSNVATRAKEVMSAPFRMANTAMLSLMTAVMTVAPTLCAKIKENLDMDTLFGSMADIILKIAFWVGALLTIGGVFQLVLAYKDDNGATRSALKICSTC